MEDYASGNERFVGGYGDGDQLIMTYDIYQRMEKIHDELSKIEKSIDELIPVMYITHGNESKITSRFL